MGRVYTMLNFKNRTKIWFLIFSSLEILAAIKVPNVSVAGQGQHEGLAAPVTKCGERYSQHLHFSLL